MGIISEFKDIMEANIYAMLEKCKDPAKMIDQTLRKCEDKLAQVRKETSSIMAEADMAQQNVDKLQAEVRRYEEAAKKALLAGNNADAEALVAKKQSLMPTLNQAIETANLAKQNADCMRQMHDKLTSDIKILQERRSTIKGQIRMAEATDRVTEAAQMMGKATVTTQIDDLSESASRKLAEAKARQELAGVSLSSDPDADLAAKYESGTPASVEDELARMRKELGIQ